MKIGKFDVDVYYESDVKEWVAKLRYDTGCITERHQRRWQAMCNLRDHWNAMRISGHFAEDFSE